MGPHLPAAHRDLLERIEGTSPSIGRLAESFSELALLGDQDTDDAATQVATVFADGNRVGALIQALSEEGRKHKHLIVRLLDACTKTAIAKATEDSLLQGQGRQDVAPILAHLAGGDDVLVSVAATRGWAFSIALAKTFQQATGRLDLLPTRPNNENSSRGNPALAQLLGGEPSLSVGLVFHHRSQPIADVISRADEALHEAKRLHLGKKPAIAFVDLTADGVINGMEGAASREDAPHLADRVVTFEELERHSAILDGLSVLSQAQRSSLRQLLRPDSATWGSSQLSTVGVESQLDALTRRVGVTHVPSILNSIGSIRPDKRASRMPSVPLAEAVQLLATPTSAHAARARLRRDLDIARWWRST
ncbi:MAG: hypothetical protein V9G19_10370 [Tetrasphaera sp.]